jgi:CRISPR-associated protein Cas1
MRKTVEIATPGTRLSVSNRQLVIERPEHGKATLPIEDLGVVVVDDQRASYMQAVFVELLASGATVLVTGRDHLPAGMMLPLVAHHAATERHRAQIAVGRPRQKQLWRAIVSAKIAQQGRLLAQVAGDDAGLAAMSRRVRSGDAGNLEAQAAQRYWPRLFGKDFRRDREADGINALLNYGYAIVRAAIARAVVAAGLIPSLGIHHHNRGNPFCLADDLLEPFRPIVDWRVHGLRESHSGVLGLEDRAIRAALLALCNETVLVGGRRWPLLLGIETSAQCLARALTGSACALDLPESLPLALEPDRDTDGDDPA